MKSVKRIICFIASLIILISCVCVPVSAEGDFYWKEHDKAYITFVFDDGQENVEFTQQVFDMFYNYGYPMCCAVVSSKVVGNEKVISLLKNVEKFGGEIMSHCYTHTPIDETNSNVQNIERQFGDSYKDLAKLGFKVNGIIETGNGGGEKSANYEMMEPIVRKYYKYSNAYGTSIQYKGTSFGENRHWLYDYSPIENTKKLIDKTVENKEWIMISAHSFKDFSEDNFIELLSYIKELGKDKVEVVTWNYMYENFGVYKGPEIPTKEVLDEIEAEIEAEKNTTSEVSISVSSAESSSVSSVVSEEALIEMDDVDFSNSVENEITTSSKNEVTQTEAGLPTTAIIAIVVGCFALVFIVAAVIIVIKIKK